ncbi:flagellar biosynthesis protein FlhF [Aquibacillus albus]|uniref:Flagellar biosynthesis protein FlhF n=1 Tax=Aquibacillus albus TaxID=1168171 RepID=A0ABS2N1A3_9BACI|nr:flagellar biosynthesis protein FlhF [Aquibacillus albus]MBM7571838.1 flagellar biosynthesis protein FlhF [Aquibacillus albus]
MKVKKFVAPTMPEVMMKVRKDLGSDAVILNSKEIHQGGFLGFFKKRNIEVIAAFDPNPFQPKQQEKKVQKSPKKSERPNEIRVQEEKQEVLNEVKELRKWMEKNVSGHVRQYPYAYQELYDSLIEQDIKVDIAKDVIQAIIPTDEKEQEKNSLEQIKMDVIQELHARLDSNTFHGIKYQKKFIHLVGPTGVGKTTTIAKIAANSVLKDNKRVAFITTDTYRIAAIDQLKTYSKILNIPLEIAYSIEDYRKAVEKFHNYDLILVDTAGRNFRDPKYVKELQQVVDFSLEVETFLVLSLTTRTSDLEEIYEQFRNIPINQLIFTKKDETNAYGSMLNLCLLNNLGIAYVTDGQDVPDDIIELSSKNLCEMIVGEK